MNETIRTNFSVRGFELNSLYAWDYDWIVRNLDFMESEGFNTLILHRNDFIDLIIYPGKYFGCSKNTYFSIFERYKECFRKLYKYTPTRRSSPYQRRAFFKRVLEQARRRNIDVYIENKELYFPDVILEFFPELIKDGKICANDPFWPEFTKVKFHEFFEEFPEVSGIITSPATGESRLSINSNRCTCDLCRNTPKSVWYEKILGAMYEEIHAAGKTLVVRDFVFDPSAHKDISEAMEKLPSDVIFSLKNTPHDYYPTFPENARIGNVGNHRQWIEFDSMGQYFGWGIGIADLLEDYRTRMVHALAKGVSGMLIRTDWESLDGHVTHKTPNKINLYSSVMLAKDPACPAQKIYDEFLSKEGWYEPTANEEERQVGLSWFKEIMSRTWDVTRHIPFVSCCVFSDSSLMPVSYDHAFWLSEEKNSLRDWDPSKKDALSPMKEYLEPALKEKDDAVLMAKDLENIGNRPCLGLKTEKVEWLRERLMIMSKYADLFKKAAQPILLARYVIETEEPRDSGYYEEKKTQLEKALSDLISLAPVLREFASTTDYRPHTIYTLLDPDRVECLYNDLKEKLHGYV